MDLAAWERKTSALDGHAYETDRDQEDEDYYEHTGEHISTADYEELLFRRVLDKIRVSRAAGDSDVQLSPAELEAYQSKLYGAKAPAVRPRPEPRPISSPVLNDTASIASADTITSKPDNFASSNSRPKKSHHRPSMSGSRSQKDKGKEREKEKHSSRKRTTPTLSSATSPAPLPARFTPPSPPPPPGFLVPGPDGQPMYAPINAYPSRRARDPEPPKRSPRPAPPTSYQAPRNAPPSIAPPNDIPGAFPGAFPVAPHQHQPPPPRQERTMPPSRPHALDHEIPPRPSSQHSVKLVPFPVEQYQYHTFDLPASNTSSPPLPYTRSIASGSDVGSYTAMPRRVPAPVSASVPAMPPYAVSVPAVQTGYADPVYTTRASSSGAAVADVDYASGGVLGDGSAQAASARLGTKEGSSGRHGERKRKSGKKG
ncbi:hypothetical protein P153DRAFT_281400 [Dothidotthia symphoricarpi CBS 119687]|uniref:Uncharacterized protein n=1 Tax=Dothidotthia symphoricarpi CBS 119687 TaxID=1392245 RepID=A0A6A6ASP3_9PLEO|nr:uncharacterized protein P153DRAFT_281400 [Dothidotthia symphoricarpi CBS 119687]KAF2133974.1 hypothetical protein P153DRAFT_281400 [Dothidotthia symphoricarpi CBS 119687]